MFRFLPSLKKIFSVFWFTKLLYSSEQECIKFNFPPNDKFRNLLPYDPELNYFSGGGGSKFNPFFSPITKISYYI